MTGLLRVRLHATGFSDSYDCYCLCDNCGYILLVKCWELSLAMDVFLFSCLDSCLCVFVLNILLLCEDEDVRLLPDELLFRIHFDVFSWARNSMWSCGFSWFKFVCEEDLQKHQVRLRIFSLFRRGALPLICCWRQWTLWRGPMVICGEPNNIYR